MLSKCLVLLLVSSFIEAEYPYYSAVKQACLYPKLEHGRVRVRQRSGLVKFTCVPRYELVGNRYAICRNGQWDVPLPVCVKSGCEELPASTNSIQIKEHHGAWVVTFCLPGHKLIGSSTVYCDGRKWNSTAPTCVDVATMNSLSCDFEEPAICGWSQDEFHDFDWKRWNKKTPSSFLFTGPSHDHTYGENKLGYYMYIESTSRMENHTARLLSPVYDSSLAVNGCFSLYYHMYGRDIGGLRVYQKPDRVQLVNMLSQETERQKYLLFEQWGNQGDVWYNAAPQLRPVGDDFQIVIEGIRGASFTSDIAIDDVAILQGDNCTRIRETAPTPAPSLDPLSCVGRCDLYSESTGAQCNCHPLCLMNMNCCHDFIDVCLNSGTTDDDDDSSASGLPQTQKLVGETTTAKPYSASTTGVITTITTSTPTTPKTTPKTILITNTNLTTTLRYPTITQTVPTTSQNVPTTTAKLSTTTIKYVTTKKIATTTQKTTTPVLSTTKKIPTTTKKILTTTQKVPATTQQVPAPTQKVLTTTQKILATTKAFTTTAKTTTDYIELEIKKQEKEINLQKITAEMKTAKPTNKSSNWKTALITIVVLAMCACLVYGAIYARSARGRHAISRLRGRTSNDSEVRYLNSNSDDDL